ncbi:uncharacterized protein LTR77_006571 [Saxophila tyrrhenica]|uniref:Major facilitator superfamily (MFS) profile domain-containing protein n=1 Tax=Saxophila tyrrhenica TaxID=1690608 RepID=A0AAV9P5N6_9PEZI|nr:hypothetical protein LTR77_006571 [Saxophila tyrrhenica]
MAFLEWAIHETSLHSLVNAGSRDIYLILFLRFLRMFAYGGAALVVGIFLYSIGNDGKQLAMFLSMTLLGDAVISYFLTVKADRIGRRRVLVVGSLLMTAAGVVFAISTNYYLLLFAAIVGVISPGAHEVGPFRAVQESILAQLTPIEARTDVYAWFSVMSTVGMATGLFSAGWITHFVRNRYEWDWKDPRVYPYVFAVYAIVGLIKACVTLLLTQKCEPDEFARRELDLADREATAPLLNDGYRRTHRRGVSGKATGAVRGIWRTLTTTLSADSRRILVRLCVLFAVNSVAAGMLPVTVVSWYLNWRFSWFVLYRVGYAMAGIWILASIANLFSASVARRVGLVRAMVFTHLPSAIFLAFIPLAEDWKLVFMLLLASSVFASMDQAPRTAFVAACFSSSERTAVMGTINLVRTVASIGGPILAGYFHDRDLWRITFLLAAALKVLYDVGLLVMFLKTKLPEYENGPREVTVTDVDVDILLSDSETFQRPPYDSLEAEDMEEDDAASLNKATTERVESVG